MGRLFAVGPTFVLEIETEAFVLADANVGKDAGPVVIVPANVAVAAFPSDMLPVGEGIGAEAQQTQLGY